MQQTPYIEVVLTCSSWQEAQIIIDDLLSKKLVACVESYPIQSRYWWQGSIEDANEIKLVMQTISKLLPQIESRVKKLHSYETPNLHVIPLSYVTKEVKDWIKLVTNVTKDKV